MTLHPRQLRLVAICLAILAVSATAATAAEFPAQHLDEIFGRKAEQVAGGVAKYSWPRSDLQVQVGEVSVDPGLALGSWAAFKQRADGGAMAMGDLVLLKAEVNPVVAALQAHKFTVTAVHNHLLGETPPVVYVHFMGMGNAAELARGLRESLEKSATPLQAKAQNPAPGSEPPWAAVIARALSRKGKLKGKVYSVAAPRSDQIRMNGEPIPPAMGVATALNFQGLGDKVASTGDFVLRSNEVNPVISQLQRHGIEVTALHSHMLDEEPRLFFMHYWAVGNPAEIGAGLKSALDQMSLKPPE